MERRAIRGGLLALLLTAGSGGPAFAGTVTLGDLSLDYAQTQEVRFDQNRFDYSFSGTLTNGGADGFDEAWISVSSSVGSIEVLDGGLVFGGAQPGQTVPTSDAFTLRVDRTVPFDPADLVFAVSLVKPGDDPADHPLIQGDAAAQALLQAVIAANGGAEIAVLGKRKSSDPVSGNAYTTLKLRIDAASQTSSINDASGRTALGGNLASIERGELLGSLPPVYSKMSTALLAAIRAAQGGTLGDPQGAATPLKVTFSAASAADLDAIEAALGATPSQRFDSQQILEDHPGPIDSPPPGYGPQSVQIRGIVAEPPLADLLTVGALAAVIELGLEADAELLLHVSVPQIHADVVQGFGVRGAGVTVAIVDSGVDGEHPNLKPRVVAHQDFTEATPVCDARASGDPPLACECPGGFCASAGTCTEGSNAGGACSVVCPFDGSCIEPWDDANGHGTHVAGIAGNSSNTRTGVAPEIELINAKAIRGGEQPSAATRMGMAWATTQGADVLNGSYGSHSQCKATRTNEDGQPHTIPCLQDADCASVENDVCIQVTSDASSIGSRQADFIVFTHNRTITFPAGNEGGSKVGDGRIPSRPADAYNAITVGGSLDPDPAPEGLIPPMIASTKGPTTDGRSKPDVSAPGFAIRTTKRISSTSHTWEAYFEFAEAFEEKIGTSMAAPHVAGLAAMLFGFGEQNGLLTDTPYLKAAILNTARRLRGWRRLSQAQPLDPGQGTGEVDALAAFKAYAEDDRIWQLELEEPGDVHWYYMDVPVAGDGVTHIVLTLVWERQATNRNPPPISDLDLFLHDPAGNEVERSISDVDNVEHIVYAAPAPGRYCVRVEADRIQGDNELYALAGSPYRLNFLGDRFPCVPDYGDAPDPNYPTREASDGARHLDWTKEWLGFSDPFIPGEVDKPTRTLRVGVYPVPSVSGENDANDPEDEDGTINLVNDDFRDNGVILPPRWIPEKPTLLQVFVSSTIAQTGYGPLGRYQASDPEKRLYLNAWADWNGDGRWDPAEKIIGTDSPTGTAAIDPETFGQNFAYTLGDPFTDTNDSGMWEPGEPFVDQAGNSFGFRPFTVTPPAVVAQDFFLRFRLDYGQNVATPDGPASFGEVEDYSNDIEFDDFPDALMDFDLDLGGNVYPIQVQGQLSLQVNLGSIADIGSDGFDKAQFEIVEMDLSGSDPTLGPISVKLRSDTASPFRRSTGEIIEYYNNHPGELDLPPFHFYMPGLGAQIIGDVVLEIEIPNSGLTAHSQNSIFTYGDITAKPAGPGDRYFLVGVSLVAADGTPIGNFLGGSVMPLPCGNGNVDPGETCDDGNVDDGDGCSSTCQLETSAEFSGTARAATLMLEIDGVMLTIKTSAGDSAEQVAARAAQAAADDLELGAAGVMTMAEGSRLITTGEIGMLEVLESGAAAAAIPALSLLGRATLVVLLGLLAAFAAVRRRA